MTTDLDMLEHQAQQRGDHELAWKSAVGAIEILMWQDNLPKAAELSERTRYPLGPLETDVNLRILPFHSAIICADAYADEPSASGPRTGATRVPHRRTNNSEFALDMTRQLGPPIDWPTAEWFARWSVHHGNPELAAQALLAARPNYLPSVPWSLLPMSPEDPDRRPAFDREVREEFLGAVTMPGPSHV